jgi:hypothetical protein
MSILFYYVNRASFLKVSLKNEMSVKKEEEEAHVPCMPLGNNGIALVVDAHMKYCDKGDGFVCGICPNHKECAYLASTMRSERIIFTCSRCERVVVADISRACINHHYIMHFGPIEKPRIITAFGRLAQTSENTEQ